MRTGAARGRRLEAAARALLDDFRRRHPGEELRCPLMLELEASLESPLLPPPVWEDALEVVAISRRLREGIRLAREILSRGPSPAADLIAAVAEGGGMRESEARSCILAALEGGSIRLSREMLLEFADGGGGVPFA